MQPRYINEAYYISDWNFNLIASNQIVFKVCNNCLNAQFILLFKFPN